jgi:phospholipid-binding lipoprotein MlaA
VKQRSLPRSGLRLWPRRGGIAALLIGVTLLAGCAAAPPRDEAYDPLEGLNRTFYGLTRVVDRIALKPAADAYIKVTPQPVRTAVSNFFDNAAYINSVVNQFLQGKFKQGFADAGRFVINSTFGMLGLFDVATSMGLQRHEEDLGQTLGVWGVGEGPYVMIPILGPATARDVPAWPMTAVTNLLFYVGNSAVTIPLSVLGAVDARARVVGAFEFIDVAAVDPYVFTREAYRQRRTFLIYDGNPPLPRFLDESDTGVPGGPPPGGSVPQSAR